METLVAADSLLNMECPDALSLEHYSESTHEQTHTWVHTQRHTNCVKMPQYCLCFLMWDTSDCERLFLDMAVTVLFDFIKSVSAQPQPRPSYRHWVSSLLLLPRWLCQQRGLWGLLISLSGPHCTQRNQRHSCSPRKEVSGSNQLFWNCITACVIILQTHKWAILIHQPLREEAST